MSWDHERVQELLAGYVVDGLDTEEETLVERALLEHVPSCEECRRALDDFRAVAGDLAFGAPAARPPETLEARLGRVIRADRRRLPHLRPAWTAALVAVVGVAALGTWNAMLTGRLSDAEAQQAFMVDAVSQMGDPNASAVPLSTGHEDRRVTMLYVHGTDRAYLLATGLPDPEGVYEVWFVDPAGEAWSGATFVPDQHGVAMVPVATNVERWDKVMITDAPEGGAPTPQVSPVASALVGG